jgi:hypothetical protein
MATYFLLPPRPSMGEHFATYLERLFPGQKWNGQEWQELAEMLGSLLARRPEVYVVFGEDLPVDTDPEEALAAGYGAEVGDEIVEIKLAHLPQRPVLNRRLLASAA